ncbi:MAG: hypothetical protein ACOX9C_13020 [Kiritimatiellia bacterium]|jgi:hypothetical protein
MTTRSKTAATLGIDFTDGELRLVGMTRNVVLFAESHAVVPPALAARLADGSRCSAAATPAACLLLSLQPPDLPESKLVRILPSLLDMQIPFPLSECQSAFTRQGKAWQAHAIRQSDLAEQLESLRQIGCNPARIVPPAAVAWAQTLIEFPPQTDDEPRALFLCGSSQTLLATGRGSVLERQTVFKTDAAEFPRRLRLSFSGIPKDLTCIVADVEHDLATQALRDMRDSDVIRLETAPSPEFLLARALAADAAREGHGNDANLRTGAFAHPAATRRQSRPFLRLAVALSSCAAILFILAGMIFAQAKSEAHTAEQAFNYTVNSLAGYKVKTRGERAVQDARTGLAAQLDTAILDYREPATSSRLACLAERAAQTGVTLHHLALDARSLTASGSAPTTDKVDEFIRLLAADGFQTVMSEAPKTGADGTLQFFLHTPLP